MPWRSSSTPPPTVPARSSSRSRKAPRTTPASPDLRSGRRQAGPRQPPLRRRLPHRRQRRPRTPNTDPHADAVADTDTDADPHSDTYADTDSDTDPHTVAYADTHPDADTYTVAYADPTPTPTPTPTGSLPPNMAVLQIDAGGGAVSPFVADEYFSARQRIQQLGDDHHGRRRQRRARGRLSERALELLVHLHASRPDRGRAATWCACILSNSRSPRPAIASSTSRSTARASCRTSTSTPKWGKTPRWWSNSSPPPTASGQIVIAFTQGSADNPSIAGIEVWTPAAIAAAPTGLTATGGNGQVTLDWNAQHWRGQL